MTSVVEEQVVRKYEKETEKRQRKTRRKKKFGVNGRKVNIVGGIDDVREFLSWFEEEEESYTQKSEMPLFDDDVAMKQHLKSWAYIVALHALSN